MLRSSLKLLCLCALVLVCSSQALADWQARHGLTAAQYQADFNSFSAQGYRLICVSGYQLSGQERYAAAWDKTPGPAWLGRHNLSPADYQTDFNKNITAGYRLLLVNGYSVNNQERLCAIWEKSAGPAWESHTGLSAADYQALFTKLTGEGYRLTHISGYAINNQPRYACIFAKNNGVVFEAAHGLTPAQYQAAFTKWTGQGYRLTKVSGYAVNNQPFYAGIWEKTPGPEWNARHELSLADYQTDFNINLYLGHELKYVCGFGISGADRFATIWQNEGLPGSSVSIIDSKINAYMSSNAVPGLSLAITKDDRLVFAKGYGLADTSAHTPVNPMHRFRIASVSKPFTSAAIMKLLEQGKFPKTGLDSTVFGPNGILGTQFGTKKPYSDRVSSITVRQLAQHISGWSNDGGDPMFNNSFNTPQDAINWMLDNREPKNAPGTAYEYLNFGYCVLGRVIEKLSGEKYDAYVKANVLAPCGITDMQIGGNTLAQRKPGEVVYYSPGVPYNLNLTRMDSHGGWIATPIDLARFIVRVDGSAAKPDILTAADITTLVTPSAVNSYGMGWFGDNTYKGHNGAMDGTIAFIVRRSDGFGFTVTCNNRPAGDGFCFNLKAVIDNLISSINNWPGIDLF
jgi:CubicO group peptidase (beta-lactamase class C family)